MNFSKEIIDWYLNEHRALPWRETQNPYFIWLSEIILQQTRVNQGLEYYNNIIREFPDIFSLARAKEEKVLKLWQGLGYYSRARNLLKTAKAIIKKHNGIFPENYEEIIDLKGIGPYTAAAILSIAYSKPFPVIDGNVLRVMSRYFVIAEPIDDIPTRNRINNHLKKLIDKEQPGNFNQAIMELGALICKPMNPECNKCPVAKACKALKTERTDAFPVKNKKSPVSKRFFFYMVIRMNHRNKEYIYINKRNDKDIWKKLFDFPLIESDKPLNLIQLKRSAGWKKIFGTLDSADVLEFGEQIIHKLTHRELIVRFVEIRIRKQLDNNLDFIKIFPTEIKKYPVPRLIEKFLEENF
jgi:A/G-specific adenine glycosylase